MVKKHTNGSKSLVLVSKPNAKCANEEYECFEVGFKYTGKQPNQSFMFELPDDVSHPEGNDGCQGKCKLLPTDYKYWTWNAIDKRCICIKVRDEAGRTRNSSFISGSVHNCNGLDKA
jgi:hypothetical protein